MKWKPFGKDLAEMTVDGEYSIHHTNYGWTAWSRIPMKCIGRNYPTADRAKGACETYNTERYGVTA